MKTSNPIAAGFPSLLTLLFITLKLLGKIDWSWWWVLSPAWGMLVLAVLVIGVVVGFGLLKK